MTTPTSQNLNLSIPSKSFLFVVQTLLIIHDWYLSVIIEENRFWVQPAVAVRRVVRSGLPRRQRLRLLLMKVTRKKERRRKKERMANKSCDIFSIIALWRVVCSPTFLREH
jgi:hypothetical protein